MDVEYSGAAPWLRVWHGNTQSRHYLHNLAELLGLVEDGWKYRLADQEITDADARAIRRAVVWVDSNRRVHIEDWSSRWVKKKRVAAIIRTAIETHGSLPNHPRPLR